MNGKEAAEAFLSALEEHITTVQDPLNGDRGLGRMSESPDEGLLRKAAEKDSLFLAARLKSVVAARDITQALLNEGFPDLPLTEIDASVAQQIEHQIRTLKAAQKRFTAPAVAAAKATMTGLDKPLNRPKGER